MTFAARDFSPRRGVSDEHIPQWICEERATKSGRKRPAALRVAPNLACGFVARRLQPHGEARRRECIRSDTRPTEQRSPRPISAQPGGRHVFWAEALLLAPHRSTWGYARRSRLASAQNPLPRMYSYFGDTTLALVRFSLSRL